MPPVLLEVRVGRPRSYGTPHAPDPMDRTWRTGIFKQAVEGPVWLAVAGLAGDGSADRRWHGGPDNAVLAYAAEHYARWRDEGRPFTFGGFGENLVVGGSSEEGVCIGDIWRVGEARLEVTAPRKPCYKLGRRWRMEELPRIVKENGRCGWYHRVLAEGWIEAGMVMALEARPHPAWPISRVNAVSYGVANRVEEAAEMVAIPQLGALWRDWIRRKLAMAAGA